MVDEDGVVVDFVAHPLNDERSNFENDIAERVADAGWHRHTQLSPEEYHETKERYVRDQSVEDLERVLFLEHRGIEPSAN